MADLQLNAQTREITGRKVKQIRLQGLVPVVVYGAQQKPTILQVNARQLESTLRGGGNAQVVEVTVDGGDVHNVLIRDIQREPVSHSLMHADFYAVNMSEKQQVPISIQQVGEPEELVAGFMVLQALDQVEIEALPADIPSHIDIDITELTLESAITVAELPALPGVEYLTDPTETVFTMIATRSEEEEEEEEELLEGDVMAEPEVLTAAKSEEDEE